jgi:hypothetical protein
MARHIMLTFERQLKPEGVMVIGDVASTKSALELQASGTDAHGESFSISRTGAAYRTLDFYLLKEILESCGYEVSMQRVKDAMYRKLEKIIDHKMTRSESATFAFLLRGNPGADEQVFMTIRRKVAPITATIPSLPAIETL